MTEDGKIDDCFVLLRRARDRVANGWTQHYAARDVDNVPCGAKDDRAASFCAFGALWADGDVAGGLASVAAYTRLTNELQPAFDKRHNGDLAKWNDDPERTKDEVLAAFDAALAVAT